MRVMRHRFAPGAVMLIVAVTGCAPRNAGFDSVDVLLRERAGLDAEWREVSPDSDLDRRVEERLAAPIGAEDAVDIAMLNNGDLQARFEDLGIARAFLVDSSLPANVEVEGEIGRFGSDRRSDFGFAATTDLTGLMFLPMRRGVAEAGFDASRIETAGRAMEFAYDVRIAFYDYQAAEQLLELDRTVLEAAAASVDSAQRLYEAGNITALELANERAFYEQARSDAALGEASVVHRREELNVWMGLSGAGTEWELAGRLAEPVPEDAIPPLAELETRAVEDSLDLLALEHRYTESARRANLARAEGLLPSLRAGAQVGREDGLRQTGPIVSVELPIFDRGQGEVARARAEMRQVEEHYRSSAVRVRAAVRTARNDLAIATRRVEHFRSVLLPLWEEIIGETTRQYNAMQAGVFELLLARREQVRTGQDYVLALRDYWRARARLDQILAGRLVGFSESTFGMDDR